jgi:hypothetical protein
MGMSELLRKRQRDVRRRPWLASVVILSVLVVAFAITGAATGNTSSCAASATNPQLAGSAFEIDTNANLTVDKTGCIDWLTGGSGTAFRSGVNAKNDKASGTGDDAFGQGTAENDVTPTIVSGSIPPNKSDLKAFGLYSEVGEATAANPTGKFLELFWSRVQNPSGTTNMDFELNKKFCDPSATPTNCASNGVTPVRSDGDRLITYDLAKGGTVPAISIRTWSTSTNTWGAPVVISGGGTPDALGAVNTTAIAATSTGGETGGLTVSLGSQDAFTFGEASLTFKALFSGSSTCGTFGSAYLKSRSSDSFTAELKDFVAPERINISNCSSISTTLSSSSITVGGSVNDSATLSGATSNAGGTVTYTVYIDSACSQGAQSAGTKTVTNGVVPDSNSITFNTVGDYYWQAAYSGDANNSSSTSTCTEEHLVVNKAKPSISTSATAQVTIGQSISDTATLSGGVSPTGTITFHLYSDSSCQTEITTGLTPVTVNGNGNYGSGDYTPTAVGTYHWIASYSGDAKNEAKSGSCTDSNEASVVGQAPTSMSTVQSAYPNDSATITSAVKGFTGNVTFTAYVAAGGNSASTNCANGVALGQLYAPEVVALPSGDGTLSSGVYSKTVGTANTTHPVSGATATVFWRVSYAGDTAHAGRHSTCTENTVLTFTNDSGPGLSGP